MRPFAISSLIGATLLLGLWAAPGSSQIPLRLNAPYLEKDLRYEVEALIGNAFDQMMARRMNMDLDMPADELLARLDALARWSAEYGDSGGSAPLGLAKQITELKRLVRRSESEEIDLTAALDCVERYVGELHAKDQRPDALGSFKVLADRSNARVVFTVGAMGMKKGGGLVLPSPGGTGRLASATEAAQLEPGNCWGDDWQSRLGADIQCWRLTSATLKAGAVITLSVEGDGAELALLADLEANGHAITLRRSAL